MTQEEKAKAYDEALDRMKYVVVVPKDEKALQALKETIFPELADSEDERIRKEIIDYLGLVGKGKGDYAQPMIDRWIAYLEKQKVNKVNTEGDFGRGYDCGYQAGYSVAMNEMKPKAATATLDSENQKEQEHPCDSAQFEEGFKTGLELGLRKKKEQKPAEWNKATINGEPISTENQSVDIPLAEWSEEDEHCIELLDTIIDSSALIPKNRIKCHSFLKSLRPQQKPNMSISFMLYLDEIRPDGKMCLSNGECNDIEDAFLKQDWPRIFRYINKYEPRWKPTKEQMKALYSTINDAISLYSNKVSPLYEEIARMHFNALESLYNDLKKL